MFMLKKVWNKLKSESKVYKAKQKWCTTGTGGGPSTSSNDPILDQTLELIGRAGVGVSNVNDSDDNRVFRSIFNTPHIKNKTTLKFILNFRKYFYGS